MIQGYRSGLVKEVAELFAIVVGVYLSRYYSLPLSAEINNLTSWDYNICLLLTYAIIFLVVYLLIRIFSHMVTTIIGAIKLDWLNYSLGAIFGTVKMLLLLSAILNFAELKEQSIPLEFKQVMQNSFLHTPIKETMNVVLPYLNFDDFKTTFQYENISSTTIELNEI